MNTTLKEIKMDKDTVFPDPKAEAIKWLKEYNERNGFPDDDWTDEDMVDEGLSVCQCDLCPCSQLTRYIRCDDCSAGVHQG